MGKDIGIDIGASTVSVYLKGQGIALNEPSIIAIDKDSGNIVKIGEEARLLTGRTPGNIAILRPFRNGINIQYDILTKMLAFFVRKVCGSRIFKPRAAISVPSDLSQGEERLVTEAVLAAGIKKVYLIDETIAAASGAGLDISLPSGNMVINIGGHMTAISVISLNKVIVSELLQTAGDSCDEAVISYLCKSHNLTVREETAEELKKAIGIIQQSDRQPEIKVHGIGYYDGLPRTISLSQNEIAEALTVEADMIAGAAVSLLEKTPPELIADIKKNGITLTGGGAMLPGLSRLIGEATGIKTELADNPPICAIMGVGSFLDRLSELA
ncbi:MAG: rod shape-determining protein [Eubacteriales bacterium]|nr:rod shape-determining protein [Eubacteriales bacterium]